MYRQMSIRLADWCRRTTGKGLTIDTTLAAGEPSRCCSPLTGGELPVEDAEELARLFKALADPTRVRLLSLVAARPDGEACICDLVDPVGLSQPTVSHHMKQLVAAGLLDREQRGKWAYYTLQPATLELLRDALRPKAAA